jgi:hypothetical protein
MNDFVQLQPSSNVFESETMVEGAGISEISALLIFI